MSTFPEIDTAPQAGEPRKWGWKLMVLLALAVAAVLLLWVTGLQPRSLVAPDGDLIEQGAAPAPASTGSGSSSFP